MVVCQVMGGGLSLLVLLVKEMTCRLLLRGYLLGFEVVG